MEFQLEQQQADCRYELVSEPRFSFEIMKQTHTLTRSHPNLGM